MLLNISLNKSYIAQHNQFSNMENAQMPLPFSPKSVYLKIKLCMAYCLFSMKTLGNSTRQIFDRILQEIDFDRYFKS